MLLLTGCLWAESAVTVSSSSVVYKSDPFMNASLRPALPPLRVTNGDGFRWVMAQSATLPANALTRSLAPWMDGWLIQVGATDSSVGFVATDTTVCTTAPCTPTNDFSVLDTDMAGVNGLATLTCGASLRNNAGHPCYIGFELRPISNANTFNKETPPWVFDQPWATTVGSAVQDSLFCSSLPQNGSASPLPPASAVANINTTNCGAGSTTCTPATLAGGAPAWWETPYAAFQKAWLLNFFTYLSTASYISQVQYFSLSIGVGTENGFICETQTGVAGTLAESIASPHTDAGLKATTMTALTSYVTYAATTRQLLRLRFGLVVRFSMANTLTAGVSTDPTWAVSEALNATNITNSGVASNGWKNYSGTNGSDQLNVITSPTTCVIGTAPGCTSSNWSNAIPAVYGHVTYVIAQNCATSTPGGGLAACDDSSASGTGAQEDTLWQWFVLAGSVGVNVIELSSKDVQCIGNLSPISPCGSGNAIQLSYQQAAQAWAQGRIPISH